jgi:hypothetical protein
MKQAILGGVAVAVAALSPLALADPMVSCTAAVTASAHGLSPSAFRAWMMRAVGPKSLWTCSNGQHGTFAQVSQGKRLVSLAPNFYTKKNGSGPVQEYQYPVALFTQR